MSRRPTLLPRTALLACCAPALAQAAPIGGVGYGPLAAAAQAVPTLSQWALWGLALVLAVLAARRAGRMATRLAVGGLIAAAALGGLAPWGGQALALPLLSMDNPAGGTVELPDRPDLHGGDWFAEYEVSNATGKAQRILSVSVEADYTINQSTQNRCTPGQTLAPGDSCVVGVNTRR